MQPSASYEDAHLVVAAIRILEHRDGHPPTVEDIAGFLDQPREWTGVLVRALAEKKVVLSVKSAFTERVEVGDHLAIETLPREMEKPTLDDEMQEFAERRRREEDALSELFTKSSAEKRKKKRMNALSEEMKAFKSKPPKGSSIFDDPADTD